MDFLKSKKGMILVFGSLSTLLLVVLVLVGGFAYAWRSNKNVPVFSPLVERVEAASWSAAKSENEIVKSTFAPALSSVLQDPEKISDEELKTLFYSNYDNELASSYEYDMNIKVDYDGADEGGRFEVGMKGDVQQKEDTGLMNLDLFAVVDIDGVELKGDGNVRVDGDMLYLKVNELPDVITEEYTDVDFKGEWYEVDMSEYFEGLTGSEEVEELDEETMRDIYELLTSDAFINNVDRLPDEISGEVRTNCYKLEMNGEEMAALFEEAERIFADNEQLDLDGEEMFTEDDIEGVKDVLNNFVFEWCVGRQDNLPYRYKFVMDIEDDSEKVVMELDAKFTNYGKTVVVEEPADAKSLEDLMIEIENTMYEDEYYYEDDTYLYDEDYYFDDEYYYDEDYYFDDEYYYDDSL